jgi:hypothetical protein
MAGVTQVGAAGAPRADCQRTLDECVAAILREIVQPERFGFVQRAKL